MHVYACMCHNNRHHVAAIPFPPMAARAGGIAARAVPPMRWAPVAGGRRPGRSHLRVRLPDAAPHLLVRHPPPQRPPRLVVYFALCMVDGQGAERRRWAVRPRSRMHCVCMFLPGPSELLCMYMHRFIIHICIYIYICRYYEPHLNLVSGTAREMNWKKTYNQTPHPTRERVGRGVGGNFAFSLSHFPGSP
jgi:hypothetical protein